MKKVLFVAFEGLPFVKVGGLADVIYALPKAINKYEVKVVLPLFKTIKEKYKNRLKYVNQISIDGGIVKGKAKIYSYVNESIEYLFVDNNKYFNRKEVYGYKDDGERYAFFCQAVVEMMIKCDYYPDICHEHDYHTSMVSAVCKFKYPDNSNIAKIKHVFTIHNLVYQGWYKKKYLKKYFGFDSKVLNNKDLIIKDRCNFMKAGICLSDAFTTVSQTYAKEIQQSKIGCGLHKLIKKNKKKLYGIVNGIDTSLFNPSTDKNIKRKYSIKDYKIGKRTNKLALQKKLGLKMDPDVMLVGMVSRLTFQKGAELLLLSIDKILKQNVQIVILGTGEKKYEDVFKELSKANKEKFAYYCGYNESLAHEVYAGIDMLLMPSSFEPCGISQLISMEYGTVPLVRATGGLKDTVKQLNNKTLKGTGFVFKEYKAKEFYNTFLNAYKQYYKYPRRWNALVKNGMRTDVSFNKSAKEYENVYKKILNN